MKIQTADGELSIRVINNATTHETTCLLEEKKRFAPEMLTSLGLTKRETEILHSIMHGKTDNEAAKICHISPLTVQKHARH